MDEALHPITNLLLETNAMIQRVHDKLDFIIDHKGMRDEFEKHDRKRYFELGGTGDWAPR